MSLIEQPNYKFAKFVKVVLSKSCSFTLSDLENDLIAVGVNWSQKELEGIMSYLRDRGIVEEYEDGSYKLSLFK